MKLDSIIFVLCWISLLIGLYNFILMNEFFVNTYITRFSFACIVLNMYCWASILSIFYDINERIKKGKRNNERKI